MNNACIGGGGCAVIGGDGTGLFQISGGDGRAFLMVSSCD